MSRMPLIEPEAMSQKMRAQHDATPADNWLARNFTRVFAANEDLIGAYQSFYQPWHVGGSGVLEPRLKEDRLLQRALPVPKMERQKRAPQSNLNNSPSLRSIASRSPPSAARALRTREQLLENICHDSCGGLLIQSRGSSTGSSSPA